MSLSAIELRVLGALIEKERTTPETYPLSSQALVSACNQRTSRDPVSDHHLQDVLEAVQRLRDKGLAATVQRESDRVPKHSHRVAEALEVNRVEAALLSVLMLRGAQTPGELRTRTERYGTSLPNLTAVEDVLEELAARRVPLVERLERSPGQSQDRWAHTLGISEERLQPRARKPHDGGEGAPVTQSPLAVLLRKVEALEERVAALEERLGG